jgi:hypothetical protein
MCASGGRHCPRYGHGFRLLQPARRTRAVILDGAGPELSWTPTRPSLGRTTTDSKSVTCDLPATFRAKASRRGC